MYLLFDLSEKDIIHIVLFDETKQKDFSVVGRNRDLLGAVFDFLKQEGLEKGDIRGIATVVGAGGFTSTRIAAVVANAFAYAQKIPVIAVQKNQIYDLSSLIPHFSQPAGVYVSATYSGAPNITVSKKFATSRLGRDAEPNSGKKNSTR